MAIWHILLLFGKLVYFTRLGKKNLATLLQTAI
jgi:hypothetical protein